MLTTPYHNMDTLHNAAMAKPDSREKPSASSRDILEVPGCLHGNGIEYYTTPHLSGFQATIKTTYPICHYDAKCTKALKIGCMVFIHCNIPLTEILAPRTL